MAGTIWVLATMMATAAAVAQQARGDVVVGCDPYQSVDEARTACGGSFRMWGQTYENSSLSFGDEIGVLTDGPYYCSSCGVGFVCTAGTSNCPPSLLSGRCPKMPSNSSCFELSEACSSNGFGWLESADVGPDITGDYDCAGCWGGETFLGYSAWEPFSTPELVIFYPCVCAFFILATALEFYSYAKKDNYKEYYILRTLGYLDKDGQRQPIQFRCPSPPRAMVLPILGAVAGSLAISACIQNLASGHGFGEDVEASCSMRANLRYHVDSNLQSAFGDTYYAWDIENVFEQSGSVNDTVRSYGRSYWIEIFVIGVFVLLFQLGLTSLAISLSNFGLIGDCGMNMVKIAIPLIVVIVVMVMRKFTAGDTWMLILDWFISLSTYLFCTGPASYIFMKLLGEFLVSNRFLKAPPQVLNPGIMWQMPVSPSGYQVQVIGQDASYPAQVIFIDPSFNTGQVLSPNERSSAR